MKTVRIFISSPGDVAEEREKARRVIESLQRQFGDDAELVPLLWEDLAIPASASFQEGIDRVLEEKHRVDVAVFILWSRLGSPLGGGLLKSDGTAYRSGTEREFDMMLEAYKRSGKRSPVILAYTRDDGAGFNERLDARILSADKLMELVRQSELVKEFIREKFHDAEGRNLHAYHTYKEPLGFAQRLHSHLRDAIEGLLGTGCSDTAYEGTPYPGLRVFGIEESDVFFGRDEETCALLGLLRERQAAGCGFVCVVGASGSGKSSLTRAGVAATLRQRSFDESVREWRVADFLPPGAAGDIFTTLADCLCEALPDLAADGGIEQFARYISERNHEAAAVLLRAALRTEEARAGGPVRVILLVDQMEELWAGQAATPEQREAFLEGLELLARSGGVAVLATLRSDFYSAAQASESFLRLKGRDGHYDLPPPGASALRALIVRPARRAGLRFERPEGGMPLDEVILNDALRDPSALPLLQFALAELYERRDKRARLLTFEAYRAMGGVEGALGRGASQALADLPAAERAEFGAVLRHLVSVDTGQRAVRRRALLADLASTPERRRLVDALVARRLLVASDKAGAPAVTLAHDALLRCWEEVAAWISENLATLAMRSRVEQLHAIWEDSRRELGRLLSPGSELREGLVLLRKDSDLLPEAVREFVQISQRRAARRRLVACASAAAVALACLAALLWWWDTTRVKTARYLNVTERFGVPQGIGLLDADAASRVASHEIKSRGGRVLSVTRINGSGTPVDHPDTRFSAAARELSYKEDGALDEIRHLSRVGRVLAVLKFNRPETRNGLTTMTADIKSEKGGAQGLRTGEGDALSFARSQFQGRTEITVLEFVYDKEGHLVRSINLNQNMSAKADANGVFGSQFVPGPLGLAAEQTYLAPSGSGYVPTTLPDGIQSVSHRYDKRGNETNTAYFGTDGKPVPDTHGVAVWTRQYDERGNETNRTFFGIDGNPVPSKKGIASVTSQYDERGNQTNTAFFGIDGKPVLDTDGYASWTSQFDARGNETNTAFFGTDGKPVLHKDGYASVTSQYDERGNQTNTAYFGTDGKPVPDTHGVAVWTRQYDERGNETNRTFFGTDGQPVPSKDGYASWTAQYDERGNLTNTAYFGTDGQPVLHKEGYASETAQFDARGNQTNRAFFGTQGEPVFNVHGLHRRLAVYDDRGKEIESRRFGPAGEPVANKDGYHLVQSEFDARGNLLRENFYGLDDLPCVNTDIGAASREQRYDASGRLTETLLYGTGGSLIDGKEGWARETVTYDPATGAELARIRHKADGSEVQAPR